MNKFFCRELVAFILPSRLLIHQVLLSWSCRKGHLDLKLDVIEAFSIICCRGVSQAMTLYVCCLWVACFCHSSGGGIELCVSSSGRCVDFKEPNVT